MKRKHCIHCKSETQ